MNDLSNLRKDFPPHTYEQWREVVDQQLKGKPFEKLFAKTYEGIEIRPMYFEADLEGRPQVGSMPGFPPYVRGTTALGHVAQPWAVAQEIPYGDPRELNRAAHHDLARGQTALNIPLDAATRAGQAPPEAAEADIGAGGLSAATLADWSVALEGIDLQQTPLVVHPGACGLATAALLVGHVEATGGRARGLRGCVATDPLATLAATGTLPCALDRAWFELAQLTAWSRDYAPALRTVAVSGDVWHEAGGSAVQELGFALAAAVETFRALGALGLDINEVAPRTSVGLALGSDFFMEIAKLRAARMVWAQMVEAFGGSAESQKVHLHARSARWNKTATDPWVNMIRVTTEAFSGICGGCDSLHVSPFDAVLGLPTDFSRRVARNVQIVLREEAHAGRTVDPAGGSWYVEVLTEEVAQRAWALMQQVEAQGGLAAALRAGWVQDQLAQTAAARAKNIATRKDVFVGTNKYPNPQERPVETHPVDHEALVRARREATRRAREQGAAAVRQTALAHLSAKARTPHAMEAAIAAARAGATLSDLFCALHDDESVPQPVTPVRIHRGAEGFERLRRRTQRLAAERGGPPRVFLANLGPIPQHKARAEFATGFFELAAFEVLSNDGFDSPEAAARAAVDSGAPVVCICSTDAAYPEWVPPLLAILEEQAPGVAVLLAGYPTEHVDALRAAGVDDFIHLRSDALSQLETLQQSLGVRS
jgi:methylmalonyl-CoA mutase